MINKVLNYIEKNKILEYGDSVILGVSGGADSICMLYVLNELKPLLGLTLNVVHVNHHIRGEEAQKDADYVRDTCEKLGIKFVQVDADICTMAKKTGMSEEEAGRNFRYETFYNMASKWNAHKIAVAHNLNDNSETILFNLFRGTGIKGLTGIPCRRDMVVRPLLCCTRTEIEEYLKKKNIEFCTDITNTFAEYTRNKIRLELLPYIKENINERTEYNIVNAAENLGEISDFLDKEANKAYDEYVRENIFLKEGFEIHPALRNKVLRLMILKQAGKLKDITRTHVLSVSELDNMEVSKEVSLPYGLVAVRVYEGIEIKKKTVIKERPEVEEIIIENGQIFSNNKLEVFIETNEFNIENIEELVYTKWFDYDKIGKLIIRNRQKGDYIVIDDKGNRKKLKDYFINEKIPKDERDNVLLVADGSHVVWIIGYRISSYYKVTAATSKIIKLMYKKQ